jgi:hypothetical protein
MQTITIENKQYKVVKEQESSSCVGCAACTNHGLCQTASIEIECSKNKCIIIPAELGISLDDVKLICEIYDKLYFGVDYQEYYAKTVYDEYLILKQQKERENDPEYQEYLRLQAKFK